MATKPIGDLLDPAMADPVRSRRIAACMRAMDNPATLRELRRSRGLTQGRIAVRLKRSRENVSRLERENDPGLSNGESL
ncbi:MAG: helix-turn-helix domain-containing protein [Thermomicrobiales bacterium]